MKQTLMVAAIALATSGAAANAQVVGPTGTRLDSALSAIAAAGFSGVVRVDQDGATILRKGYGLANREAKTAFSPASVVQIGSNTKDFTIVALLQLYDRGKVGTHDSISKYFPAAPADKRNITIWQLVTHQAGFPIGLGGDFEPIGRAALIDAAMKRPLQFAPGTGEQYSNTGYSLLAAIIEQTSGMTYDEYVRENILKPLNLRETGLLLPNFPAARLAHGYQSGADQGTMVSRPHATDGPYWNLRGNGGMLSTVDDMHAFYDALFGDKLLKPPTMRLRFHPDEPIGLAGSDGVCSFVYARLPGRRISFTIASNTSEWPERRVRDAMSGILGLAPPQQAPMAAKTAKTNVKAPPAMVAATIRGFIAAVNGGDTASLRTFITAHFANDPSAPPLAARIERMRTMHNNLGMLTVTALDQTEPGRVEALLMSPNEGAVTIKFQIDPLTPDKILGIQVSVG